MKNIIACRIHTNILFSIILTASLITAVSLLKLTHFHWLFVLLIMCGFLPAFWFLIHTQSFKLLQIEKITFSLLYATAIVGPSFFVVNAGVVHIFPFRLIIIVLWFLLFIRLSVIPNMFGSIFKQIHHISLYLHFFVLWFVYALCSSLWSLDKVAAIRHLFFLGFAISLIFFSIYYIRFVEDVWRMIRIWFAMFCLLIAISFWEHFTGHHLPISGLAGEVRERFIYAPTGFFHNQNDFATFLALSIPFAIVLIKYSRRFWVRFLGLISAIAASYLILVAGSRANLVALLFELIFMVVFLSTFRQKIKMGLIAFLFIGLIALSNPVFWNTLMSQILFQFGSLYEQASLGIESVAVRTNLIGNCLYFLFQSMGFGVGAGNVEYWMANAPIFDTAGILNPHNWWLEVLANYGIMIFVGYVIIYGSLLISIRKRWKLAYDIKEKMVSEALLLALVGFSIASISSSSIMAFKPNWMLFGLSLAFLNIRSVQRYHVSS